MVKFMTTTAITLAVSAPMAYAAAEEHPVTETDLVGTWTSVGCEGLTFDAETGTYSDYWKRTFTFTDESKWQISATAYSDTECTSVVYDFTAPTSPDEYFLGADHPHFNLARYGYFFLNTADSENKYNEFDLVSLFGGYLWLGARPIDGTHTGLNELSKRPHSLGMPLVKTGTDPVVPAVPTLATIAGVWTGPCEEAGEISVATGRGASFFTRTFDIATDGSWTGTFQYYSDFDCENVAGEPFVVENQTLEVGGASANIPFAVDVTSRDAAGEIAEYDIVALVDDHLLWGARPLDGMFLDSEAKRPVSFAPPLNRVPEDNTSGAISLMSTGLVAGGVTALISYMMC